MNRTFPLLLALSLSAPAYATPHHGHPHPAPVSSATAEGGNVTNTVTNSAQGGAAGDGGTARVKNSVSVENKLQHSPVPDVPGPVPRGFVPVLSVYGQMDNQGPVYGAQISIPLAR